MPELRKKILYTLFIILIFRFGSCIPVPFIDTQLLAQYFEQASTNGSMLGYLDMFSGGGLSRATDLRHEHYSVYQRVPLSFSC